MKHAEHYGDGMLTLRTQDGVTHSANTWHALIRSAAPGHEPEHIVAALIRSAKRAGYDVLHGQNKNDPPTGTQLLWRLHECGQIQLVVDADCTQ